MRMREDDDQILTSIWRREERYRARIDKSLGMSACLFFCTEGFEKYFSKYAKSMRVFA